MDNDINQQDPFIGVVLLQKFLITEKLNDSGAYGQIYTVQSMDGQSLVVKISEE
jgi:hypothetical protein